jgi:hypothetical protein
MHATTKCGVDVLRHLASRASGENFLVCGKKLNLGKFGLLGLRIPEQAELRATNFFELPLSGGAAVNAIVSFSR